ncbi:hypothetical protein AGMMS49942_19800 [Spirochaetia bacterium]|nr:hypothetical protein AGMMS49942_19800 [Spirochaetia bacterium]
MSQEDGYKKLLTLKEVAQILNVSTQWMYRHIKTGTLPIDRIRVGKEFRFSPAAIDQFLHQNSIAAGEDYETKRLLAKRQQKKEGVTELKSLFKEWDDVMGPPPPGAFNFLPKARNVTAKVTEAPEDWPE